ncbi:MAG: hypothetical protein WDZ29_03485 [Balneolaceae bacterium]
MMKNAGKVVLLTLLSLTFFTVSCHVTDADPDPDNGNGGNGNGDDNEVVTGPSGPPAALVLTGVTHDAINIRETGGTVNSAFTFEVQDAAGRPISGQSATVLFEIVAGPDGGESITPTSVTTNAQGRATSNIQSGSEAGVVMIEASIEGDDSNGTIRSKPIAIAIHGGFPDEDHFRIAAQQLNFEGWGIVECRNPITAIVGDRFGNPVKQGTPVWFETSGTGGVIQGSGQGHTNVDGIVRVDLLSGKNPPDPSSPYATITAWTRDIDGNDISATIPILFSGPPAASEIQVTPQNFTLAANGSRTYTLTVADLNGFPLPIGTSITVELDNEILTLGGQTEISVPNALFPGPGVTEFSFSVRDLDEDNFDTQSYSLTIHVDTPGCAGFQSSLSKSFQD